MLFFYFSYLYSFHLLPWHNISYNNISSYLFASAVLLPMNKPLTSRQSLHPSMVSVKHLYRWCPCQVSIHCVTVVVRWITASSVGFYKDLHHEDAQDEKWRGIMSSREVVQASSLEVFKTCLEKSPEQTGLVPELALLWAGGWPGDPHTSLPTWATLTHWPQAQGHPSKQLSTKCPGPCLAQRAKLHIKRRWAFHRCWVHPATPPWSLLTVHGRVWSSQTIPTTTTAGSCLLPHQLPNMPTNPALGPATAPSTHFSPTEQRTHLSKLVSTKLEYTECQNSRRTQDNGFISKPESHWLATEVAAGQQRPVSPQQPAEHISVYSLIPNPQLNKSGGFIYIGWRPIAKHGRGMLR